MIDDVSAGVRMARDGRANGSIIGRNTSSQRSSGRWSTAILTKRRGRGEDVNERFWV